ncbi:hypothetical protein LJC59_08265, partial [Desulfovibrio sp. OttesenSCG-928-A18]|nr:hypothetical protein [Desulfovibrio sp. OttesenSCG-928-A18]
LAALYRLSHMDAAPDERVVRFCLEQAVKLTDSGIGFLFVANPDGDGGSLYLSHALRGIMDKRGGGQGDPGAGDAGEFQWEPGRNSRFLNNEEVAAFIQCFLNNKGAVPKGLRPFGTPARGAAPEPRKGHDAP